MTSPYPIRTRQASIAVHYDLDLFQKFELSPKTTSKHFTTSASNKQPKMAAVIKAPFSTPQLRKNKTQSHINLQSQQELFNSDLNSSSMNNSLMLIRKSTKKEFEDDRSAQNPGSMPPDQSFLSCSPEPEKAEHKKCDDQFVNEKKSYRKQNHKCTVGVPYRKCHSLMEQKVVNIINKIKNGKQCHKQIETLMDRIKKISTKELHNRYFVSGVHAIYKLINCAHFVNKFDSLLIEKTSHSLQQLSNRILEQLDSVKCFEARSQVVKEHCYPKDKLIRRVFKILRKKMRDEDKEAMQQKAITTAHWFLENKINNLHDLFEELAC